MQAKTIRRRDYVQMARLGGGTWYLIRTHIGHELWPLLTINALAVVDGHSGVLGLSDPLARSCDDARRDFRSWTDFKSGSRRWGWCCHAAPAGGRAGGTTEEDKPCC